MRQAETPSTPEVRTIWHPADLNDSSDFSIQVTPESASTGHVRVRLARGRTKSATLAIGDPLPLVPWWRLETLTPPQAVQAMTASMPRASLGIPHHAVATIVRDMSVAAPAYPYPGEGENVDGDRIYDSLARIDDGSTWEERQARALRQRSEERLVAEAHGGPIFLRTGTFQLSIMLITVEESTDAAAKISFTLRDSSDHSATLHEGDRMPGMPDWYVKTVGGPRYDPDHKFHGVVLYHDDFTPPVD